MSNTFAVETDTKLAEAHGRLTHTRQRLVYAADVLRRNAGQTRTRSGRWSGTVAEALVRSIDSTNAWNIRELAEYNKHLATVLDIQEEIAALDIQYTGWSRFFLVTNTNGHVHSSMSCSTCFNTTTFAWLPQLSGLTEAEAVADQGEILCSVCFPSAPVVWTTGVSKASVEAREARQEKSVALAAKKAEKALGTVLRVGGSYKECIETIAAAKRWLADAAEWARLDGKEHPSFPAEDITLVSLTLAERLGTTADEEIAAAANRAAKRKWT